MMVSVEAEWVNILIFLKTNVLRTPKPIPINTDVKPRDMN
jgi:hypothetical protein